MALPTPGVGRRGLVSFALFGFPVTIHSSFLVVVALLGYSSQTGISGALIWLVVVTVSVVAHELGHAVVAAPAGGEPRIDLYMFAGLTTWRPQRASRGRRVAVSVAGPGFGLVFGLFLLGAYAFLDPVQGSVAERALVYGVFANIAWGVLNLLPMLPLDGGQVMYALMPGDDTARLRRTAAASLVVAGAVALAAMAFGEVFAAIVVIIFAAGNAQTLMALRRPQAQADNPIAAADRMLTADDPQGALAVLPDPTTVPDAAVPAVLMLRSAALLRLGLYREAQDALFGLPPGYDLDPAFEAAVLLVNGQERLAQERLLPRIAQVRRFGARELVLMLRHVGYDPAEWLGVAAGEPVVAEALANTPE